MKVTLTQVSNEVENGEHTETYRVNAQIAKGLLKMVDGFSVPVRTEDGQVFTDSKYALYEIIKNNGQWLASFVLEEEHYTEETMIGMIYADISLAIGLTEGEFSINWRAC